MQRPDKNDKIFITETSISGVLRIERPVYPDQRGFFHEIVRMNDLKKASGIDFHAVQMSHSMSIPGVIRAIHTEKWNKIVYPITGKIFIAIVDVRPNSSTFGKYETFSFDNDSPSSTHTALFLPSDGIGNSVCAAGDASVHYFYAVDEYWDNSKAQGIAWNDPDINIPWPVNDPIISDRDQKNPTLRELFPYKFK